MALKLDNLYGQITAQKVNNEDTKTISLGTDIVPLLLSLRKYCTTRH